MLGRIFDLGLVGILGSALLQYSIAPPEAMERQYRDPAKCIPAQISLPAEPSDRSLYEIIKKLIDCESYGGNLIREKGGPNLDVFKDGFRYTPEPNTNLSPHTLGTRINVFNKGANNYMPITSIFVDKVVLIYDPNGMLLAVQVFDADYDLNSGHVGHSSKPLNPKTVRISADNLKKRVIEVIGQKYVGNVNPQTIRSLELAITVLTSTNLLAL